MSGPTRPSRSPHRSLFVLDSPRIERDGTAIKTENEGAASTVPSLISGTFRP